VAVTAKGSTLRRQLLGWLTLPLLILWITSSIIDYDIANRFVNLAYDRTLLQSALDIGRQVKVLNNRIYVDLPEIAVEMLQSRESGRAYYLVTGPDNEYITGEPDLPAPPDPSSGRISYYDDQYRGRPVRMVTLQLPVEIGRTPGMVTIQIAESRAARQDFQRQILVRMLTPQAALIIAALVMLWYAVGRGLAPLASLRREIESRSHRDLSPLPLNEAPQEVQPLLNAMNGLLQRLSDTLTAQQRFIADAAHQLRTPIAGLKTQTELALRQSQSGEAQATLQQLRNAAERTTRLVNQLLSLARAEPGVGRVTAVERVDLAALACDTTADWVPRALERNIDLGVENCNEAIMVDGDAMLLGEALNSLLDNAIRYTQPGGHVTVRLARHNGHALLSVEDDGPGIPQSDRERVFERFYRVLGTGVEGCGLGLAITREIARGHNGDASVSPGPEGKGTVANILLPIGRQSA